MVAMARMDEWPAWQRWGTWLVGWVVYLGAFWLVFASHALAMRLLALVCMCIGLLVLAYASRAVLNERMRSVDRWHVRSVLPALMAYVLLMVYVWPLAEHVATPWPKVLVVLLPILPMLFVAWSMIRYVNRCDEMERRQHLESAGIAVVVVSMVSMALGLLAAARLIAVNGALALLFVFPALCIVYGLACVWFKWRNRAR
jgi:hypothetical protein